MQFRSVYHLMAWLPLLGFAVVYSFWPLALLFGTYRTDGVGFFWNDPTNVGFPKFYALLRSVVLPSTLLIQLGNMLVLLGCSVLSLTDDGLYNLSKLSRSSIALVIGTLVVMLLSFSFDPGCYWFWFID